MRKASEIVTALFRERFGKDFAETAMSTAGLFSSWVQIVSEVWLGRDKNKASLDPPAVAVHSRIHELERGVLLIEADHPGWVQILQTKQAELLFTVQKKYPELAVKGIAFRLSREPFPIPKEKVYPDVQTSCEVEPWDKNIISVEDKSQESFSGKLGNSDSGRDEEFYAALKRLEKSFIKRNSM